jgi:16S rRNA (uracil1498-N3)-methyltransferase
MHLFYTPGLTGTHHTLDEQESKHAVRVLRLAAGDEVVLVDGRGGWYGARISEDHPKRCLLEILSHTADYQPMSYHLHIAIAPTKSMDRFEWFLEKATEIGVSQITPLFCQRSERKQVKTDRLDRILISAMKQSLKAYKPVLSEPVSLEEFLGEKQEGVKAIAHCIQEERRSIRELGKGGPYTLLIGPEGDFTPDEVKMAVKSGYMPVELGPSRLRTETAGVHV